MIYYPLDLHSPIRGTSGRSVLQPRGDRQSDVRGGVAAGENRGGVFCSVLHASDLHSAVGRSDRGLCIQLGTDRSFSLRVRVTAGAARRVVLHLLST